MRLIKFSGINVRGNSNFEIKFFENLNFLIGANGSGKTTVLNLISGLLKPSYQKLAEIDYDKIDLHLMNRDQEDVFITSEKKSDKMILRFRYGENESIKSEFYVDNKKSRKLRRFSAEDEFNESDAVRQIKKMTGFLYLGIDRLFNEDQASYFEMKMTHDDERRDRLSNLDLSLGRVQNNVFFETRKSKARISALSEVFKGEILKESLSFVDNISYADDFELKSFSEKLHAQQKELNTVIETYKMGNLADSCNSFFSELEKVMRKFSGSEKESLKDEEKIQLLMQIFVNKSILTKINKIVDIGKKNADNILKAQENITRFTESANTFLTETNKKISVNQLGEIIVRLSNGEKKTIFDLSSGEKHLIIILAYLAFSDVPSSVFVVDEPELSLHITWQEIFVDAIMKANPNAQLIFATHSPSIIARKERQKYCIDLTRGE